MDTSKFNTNASRGACRALYVLFCDRDKLKLIAAKYGYISCDEFIVVKMHFGRAREQVRYVHKGNNLINRAIRVEGGFTYKHLWRSLSNNLDRML